MSLLLASGSSPPVIEDVPLGRRSVTLLALASWTDAPQARQRSNSLLETPAPTPDNPPLRRLNFDAVQSWVDAEQPRQRPTRLTESGVAPTVDDPPLRSIRFDQLQWWVDPEPISPRLRTITEGADINPSIPPAALPSSGGYGVSHGRSPKPIVDEDDEIIAVLLAFLRIK